jgi:heptaprenyl diphosphate synthase
MDIKKFVDEVTEDVTSNLTNVIKSGRYPYSDIMLDTINIFDRRWDAALEVCGIRSLGADKQTADRVSVVIGLITQAIFVFDDVVDKTDKREGKPAMWTKYGFNTTIIAIHSLLNLALKEMIRIGSDTKGVFDALNSFDSMLIGEYHDLQHNKQKVLTKEAYWKLCDEKAGEISKMFLSIATNFTNATDNQRFVVTTCSELIGILAQVVDDLLDLDDDINEGKTSLPILLLEEKNVPLNKETMWSDLKEYNVFPEMISHIKLLTDGGITLTNFLDNNEYTGILRDVFTLFDKFCSVLLTREDVDVLLKFLGEHGIERSFKVMFFGLKPEMTDDEVNQVFDSILDTQLIPWE